MRKKRKKRLKRKQTEKNESTLLDFFPIFISQTPSFQEKKLHVFHNGVIYLRLWKLFLSGCDSG